jgi:hypothetical protein
VYVTVDGQRWQMVPLEKLTWPETKELKRLSEMPMAVASKALKQSDPDAWFAWLYVSIRRQRPTLTEAELTAAIGDTPLMAVIATAEEEAPEVAAPDPPAPGSKSDADEQPNGSGSGETIPELSTLETSGQPT